MTHAFVGKSQLVVDGPCSSNTSRSWKVARVPMPRCCQASASAFMAKVRQAAISLRKVWGENTSSNTCRPMAEPGPKSNSYCKMVLPEQHGRASIQHSGDTHPHGIADDELWRGAFCRKQAGAIERRDEGLAGTVAAGHFLGLAQTSQLSISRPARAAMMCSTMSTEASPARRFIRRGMSQRCDTRAGIRGCCGRSDRTKTIPVFASAGRNSTCTSRPLQ